MIKLHFERVTITHIILISLVLHAFVIPFPEDWLVFDESLFSWASRTLLEGVDRTPYQMPGLHIIGATSISLLGDDWFSLRVPIVIFGMLTLLVFYNICIHFTTRQNALLATTILSFDTIFFFHSQLFLRDVPMIFFGMMAFYLYLKKRYYLSAICLGGGALIKETILFFLIMIGIYHLSNQIYKIKEAIQSNVTRKSITPSTKTIARTTLFLGLVASSFLIPLWIYDAVIMPKVYEPMIPIRENADGTENAIPYPLILVYEQRGKIIQNQTGLITNPIEHLDVYFSKGLLSGAYDATKRNVTQNYLPQNWILPLPTDTESGRGGIGMGFRNADPFDEIKNGWPHKGEIMGIERLGYPNIALWPVAFWASIVFGVFAIIKRQESKSGVFIISGIISMYVPYLFIHVFNERVMLPYYFILTVPIISLGVVLCASLIKQNKIRFVVKTGILASTVAWFVFYFPVKII
ncbi:MAG: ArnT family glycosyltransferase [Candidatus Nitrosopumilus sp. Bin_571-38]